MRISDWSSDVCSSDLETRGIDGGDVEVLRGAVAAREEGRGEIERGIGIGVEIIPFDQIARRPRDRGARPRLAVEHGRGSAYRRHLRHRFLPGPIGRVSRRSDAGASVRVPVAHGEQRSEEHTYELQSLMRTSYAVFCLKK